MSYHRYIQTQPQFNLGDFSLSVCSEIDKNVLKSYNYKSDTINWLPFCTPFIKKKETKYYLQFTEGIDTISLKNTLKELCFWLEDAHFFVYYENSRYTFDKLEITEVNLKEGQLNYKTHFIKDLIPNSIFLNLSAGGVQQDFNLPIELLITQENIWSNDVVDFLISELKSLIEIDLKQIKEHGGLFYGSAFNLNYEIDCLHKLNANIQSETFQIVQSIQEEHRNLLINDLKQKTKLSHLRASVSSETFHLLEKELDVLFPLTFKLIYNIIGEGRFGPGFGFLPLTKSVYSIKSLAVIFHKQLNMPAYLIPFAYLKNGVYCCLDTSKSSFPVINFYRLKEVEERYWYSSYVQKTYSFEQWLNNWIEGIFPEIYEINTSED